MRNRGAIGGILVLTLGAIAAPSFADDSLLDSVGKATGLISPPSDPPDFVKASRPKGEQTSMPVFATPDEPRSKVKTAAELKKMDSDLNQASLGHGARVAAKMNHGLESRDSHQEKLAEIE